MLLWITQVKHVPVVSVDFIDYFYRIAEFNNDLPPSHSNLNLTIFKVFKPTFEFIFYFDKEIDYNLVIKFLCGQWSFHWLRGDYFN